MKNLNTNKNSEDFDMLEDYLDNERNAAIFNFPASLLKWNAKAMQALGSFEDAVCYGQTNIFAHCDGFLDVELEGQADAVREANAQFTREVLILNDLLQRGLGEISEHRSDELETEPNE